MAYNTTFIDNARSLYDLFEGVNTASDSLLAIMILVSTLIIIFISIKNYDTKVAMLTSTLTTTIISVLFLAMSWIGWELFAIILLLFVTSLLMVIFNK